MVEVILPENSRFARKTVAEAESLNRSELTIVGLTARTGTYAMLALLFAIIVTLGLFIVNTANAVMMIPIALAASAAFMTPISPRNLHQPVALRP